MKTKLSLGAALSVVLVASLAQAADLPPRTDAYAPSFTAPTPAMNWTGFYAGVNAGYSWGGMTVFANTVFGAFNGAQIGPTVGYNYQMGQFVLGAESDWDWSNAKGTGALAGPVTSNIKMTNLFTLRGRLGMSLDHALIYATGGYAGGTLKTAVSTAAPATFAANDWRNGYVLGFGIEYAFTNNISAKAEYLHTSLYSKDYALAWPIGASAHQNIVRMGLNYHF